MKETAKKTLVVVILLATIFVAASATFAEEPENVNQLIEDRVYQVYNEYQYPSGSRMFYLPRWHEVKFDIHNGKFFEVKYFSHHHQDLPDVKEEESFDCNVYFYTPTGKLFGVRRIKMLDKNRYHSIPHDDRSPNYERLIVKVQNNTDFNKDFIFKVLDPVDAVKGTPIKNATFRVIFHE